MDEQERKLREERAGIVHDQRAILDLAEKEKRTMTSDERDRYEKMDTRKREIKTQIDDIMAHRDRLNALKADEDDLRGSTGGIVPPETDNRESRTADEQERRQFNLQLRSAFKLPLSEQERRDLQTDKDTQAGYLVPPISYMQEIIKDLDDSVLIRRLARRILLTKATSLGRPKRTAKMSTFARGREIEEPTTDTSLKYGLRVMEPHDMAGLIYVSRDLIENSPFSIDQIVREEMTLDRAEMEEAEFMTGTGANGAALGLFTASDDGISASRDVSTGNETSSPTADGLKEAKFKLKATHRRKSRWIFHRDTIKLIDKLKDGNGRYLWEDSTKVDEPDTLLGLPVEESEYAPNTFTSGMYVGILGNFFYYNIVDSLDMTMQVLNELKALSNQVGFIARAKMDAAPVLEEAFVRIKLK